MKWHDDIEEYKEIEKEDFDTIDRLCRKYGLSEWNFVMFEEGKDWRIVSNMDDKDIEKSLLRLRNILLSQLYEIVAMTRGASANC